MSASGSGRPANCKIFRRIAGGLLTVETPSADNGPVRTLVLYRFRMLPALRHRRTALHHLLEMFNSIG